jgi:dolichol-phosphate mannosyltransferase
VAAADYSVGSTVTQPLEGSAPKTLVVVVTYNEAENIARLLRAIRQNMPGSSILVVDDNSPDGTTNCVRAVQSEDLQVHVICRTTERGYGSATITALQYGLNNDFEHILTLDADFSHDPADLPRIQEALTRADVTVGSRYVGGVRVLNWEIRRLLLSIFANAYVRRLAGLSCLDCTSGFRGYRSAALAKADIGRIRTTGYAFLPELLFRLGRVVVEEVPVCYTERRRGESKMSQKVIVEAMIRPWVLLALRTFRLGPATRDEPEGLNQ